MRGREVTTEERGRLCLDHSGTDSFFHQNESDGFSPKCHMATFGLGHDLCATSL